MNARRLLIISRIRWHAGSQAYWPLVVEPSLLIAVVSGFITGDGFFISAYIARVIR